jgi:hypothetical protein
MFNSSLPICAENFNPDLMEVITNPDLIFCFDNVIDPDTLLKISEYDWRARQWQGGARVSGLISENKDIPPADFKSGNLRHEFSKVDKIRFPFFETGFISTIDGFLKLDPDFKIVDHIGSYWTIQDEKLDNIDQVHRDYYDFHPCWSVLFHFLGDSGPTEFYRSFYDSTPYKTVDFKPGQMILFPSIYPHRAGVPNHSLRICHSVRLIIDSKLNKDILKNSPGLKI